MYSFEDEIITATDVVNVQAVDKILISSTENLKSQMFPVFQA